MDPITCGCCFLLLLVLLGGSGGSHTTNTIVITPYGPQTVQTKTKKSMGIIELLLLFVIGLVAVLSLSLYLMAS